MIEVHWSVGAFIVLSQIGLWIKLGFMKKFFSLLDAFCKLVARNMFRTLYVRMQSPSKKTPVSELPYFLKGKPASMHLGSYIKMQNDNAAGKK
ncbi:hypothetical protein [Thaumasiovibrio subtropicus]|uniref:hypothetical protein n=1 Tax=Thaumasiovibrio subtropicus TaxID=1891207 RepID=UPI00131D68AF|nr:hypothetical protein [Thaumasiovibrio subtropicus]